MSTKEAYGFDLQASGRTPRLVVSGEIDIAAEEALVRAAAAALVHCGEAAAVVLDLSGVTFMDSSGLRAVLRCQDAARGQGASLTLAVPGGTVARLFALAGVNDRFDYE